MEQLGYSLSMAVVLCELGCEKDALPCVSQAHDALVRANWISRKTGNWAMSEESYRQVCAALAVHDLQLERATPGQMSAAEQVVSDQHASGCVIHVEAFA
jgi:hypothetical protein